ncbi:hypothetical protein ACFFNY_23770 [Paenibacillus hodogayensis]|uniref:Uncharacterized protein n=1 Tax=Paenibacillus hodogayensis TaxID=279208 RepID=A0ABV5W2Q1_9BACL
MDQILAELQKIVTRVLSNVGLNEEVVLKISQKLGELQALLDSVDDEQTIATVQEKWKEVQSKIGTLQLDDSKIADALKSVGSLNDKAGSSIQSLLNSLKLDEQAIMDFLQKIKKS